MHRKQGYLQGTNRATGRSADQDLNICTWLEGVFRKFHFTFKLKYKGLNKYQCWLFTAFFPSMALNIYYSHSFKLHWQLFMTILSKPSGQQTRQDIILRLRKENEKEGCEQKADWRGRGSCLLSTAEENCSPYCVCSESDYLQSLLLRV